MLSNANVTSLFKKNDMKVDCAIFAAMPEELAPIRSFFTDCPSSNAKIGSFKFTIYEYQQRKILLAATGIGTTFAGMAVTLVHQHFHPDYLFLVGTAGGIHANAKLRDVVIVEKAYEAEIQSMFAAVKGTPFESCLQHPLKNKTIPAIYSADVSLLANAKQLAISAPHLHIGTVVSSNTFPAPIELFAAVKAANAYSIDMETSAFYQAAWLLNVPALALRGISNILNHDGTDDLIHESDVAGSSLAVANVLLDMLRMTLKLQPASLVTPPESNPEVTDIIHTLHLEPHPEGGHFAVAYKSNDLIKSTDPKKYNNEERSAGTSIYYLLNADDFSAWHSLTSDEIWHYYKGSPVTIHTIDQTGTLTSHLLGDPFTIDGATFQVSIRSGVWFAAQPVDKASYSLIGCTVSPGFEFHDFTLADRDALQGKFPQHADIIEKLTRVPAPSPAVTM